MKGRKGVSPLIAAVLLIAFTMAIAAILTAWVTTFTTEKKEQSEAFSEQIQCSGQNFRVESDFTVYYTNGTFETRIRNTGITDVYIDEYKVWLPGSTVPQVGSDFIYNGSSSDVVLIPKNTLSTLIRIAGLSAQPDKVQFLIGRCEGVYSTIRQDQWTR